MIWIILGKYADHYVDSTPDVCLEEVSGYHLKKIMNFVPVAG